MKIFEAKTFSDYLKKHLSSLPNKGRGELRQISLTTGIHSTTLSQAVNGGRPFSLEQVATICRHIGLGDSETKYALTLLQAERAGTQVLREIFLAELHTLRQQASELVHVMKKDKVLSESEKAIFYSNWYYSAIAVLSSIKAHQNSSALSARTGLSKQKTAQALEFLVKAGICAERNGKIEPGANSTHLEARSPLVSRHHGNWRIKAMEKHPNLEQETEIAYTSPMSLSKADANKIRALIVDLVRKVGEIRDPSPCEEGYFLKMEWVRM